MTNLMSDGRERPTAETTLQKIRANRPGLSAPVSESVQNEINKAIAERESVKLIKEYWADNKKQASFYIRNKFTFAEAQAHYANKLANKLKK